MSLEDCYCFTFPIEAATVRALETTTRLVAENQKLVEEIGELEERDRQLKDIEQRLRFGIEVRQRLEKQLGSSLEPFEKSSEAVKGILEEHHREHTDIKDYRDSRQALASIKMRIRFGEIK